METVRLSTIVQLVYPEIKDMLTEYELEMPIVLRDGIHSVSNDDLLEIIEASILNKGKSAFLH